MDKNKDIKVTETELPPSTGRLKLSWAQHRRIYCAALGLVFAFIFFLSAFALISSLAQGQVDDSILILTDLKFLKPTADSIHMAQNASLYSKSSFTPTLDSSVASLYVIKNGTYSTNPISDLYLPKIHVQRPAAMVSLEDAVLSFKSDGAFNQVADFALQIFTEETVKTALIGTTMLNLGFFPKTKVNYNKTVSFIGLNGLKNFNVTDLKMNLTAAPSEPNLRGLASIPNPSMLTFELGNMTLLLSTDKAGVLGTSEIQNVRISPGSNVFPLVSYVNQTKIIQSLDRDSGTINLSVMPVSSVFNGEKLTFLERAFAANKFNLRLNVTAILANSS